MFHLESVTMRFSCMHLNCFSHLHRYKSGAYFLNVSLSLHRACVSEMSLPLPIFEVVVWM